MKVIAFAGTGTDNVDVKAASEQGIIVMNAPGANTVSTAEHTCAMICTVVRNIPKANKSMKEGKWETAKLTGIRLQGRTLAIIGLGAIGKEVAKRMKAFQMTLIGYDPFVTKQQAKDIGVEWYPLSEIWPRADIITLHLPAIPQTFEMVNDSVFAKCHRGVYLVNVARGTIVRERSLLRALRTGKCAAAALDVFQQEPTHNEALIQHPNIIATPHIGANTVEAQVRVAANVAHQIANLANCTQLSGTINCREMQGHLKAWCQLGQNLGQIVASYIGKVSSQTDVKVMTYGPDVQGGARLMKYMVESRICREQKEKLTSLEDLGLQISVGHADTCTEAPNDVDNGIKVTVCKGDVELTLCGTVRGDEAVLCGINTGVFVHGVTLKGNILIYRCKDTDVFLPFSVLSSSDNNNMSGFASSTSTDGQKWTLVYLKEPLEDCEPIKPFVNFVMQMSV
ncbi:D-3-phosphoglycerate dehydrogenase-like isoform X2 [Glandiceps talaboti]